MKPKPAGRLLSLPVRKTFVSVWNTLSILHRIEKRNMPEERGPNEMAKPKTEYLIS